MLYSLLGDVPHGELAVSGPGIELVPTDGHAVDDGCSARRVEATYQMSRLGFEAPHQPVATTRVHCKRVSV